MEKEFKMGDHVTWNSKPAMDLAYCENSQKGF